LWLLLQLLFLDPFSLAAEQTIERRHIYSIQALDLLVWVDAPAA